TLYIFKSDQFQDRQSPLRFILQCQSLKYLKIEFNPMQLLEEMILEIKKNQQQQPQQQIDQQLKNTSEIGTLTNIMNPHLEKLELHANSSNTSNASKVRHLFKNTFQLFHNSLKDLRISLYSEENYGNQIYHPFILDVDSQTPNL